MNTLRQAIHEYLTLRRNLGFKLKYPGNALLDFAGFMEAHNAPYITQALALAWAKKPVDVKPVTWSNRLTIVRVFARYRSASDRRTQVPAHGLLPCRTTRAHPYLYSEVEIFRLLDAAINMAYHDERAALRPWIFYTLFGLLSVSGMRLSEALNLEIQDVNLADGILTIRSGKFGKDRLVPLHTSSCDVLSRYMIRRGQHWKDREISSYLFVSKRGRRLDAADVHRTFYSLSQQIGLRGRSDSYGPRLHDMRHVFATNTLVRWYQSGQDPERRLPILSAYLGHISIASTQWYLNASPELMRESMRRLEQNWEGRS